LPKQAAQAAVAAAAAANMDPAQAQKQHRELQLELRRYLNDLRDHVETLQEQAHQI